MSKQVSPFWVKWLVGATFGVIVFSLGLIFIPDTMREIFNQLYLPSDVETQFSDTAENFINFVYGILGAVMIGWAIMLLSTILGGFRRGEQEAWITLSASMVSWFVLDSGFSVAMGFPENALFNLAFFIVYAIPLGATYRQFMQPAR